MFNIGIGEIIIILAIALVFLGPEKFPVFAKTLIHAYRDLRGYYDEVKRDVIKELNPVKKELNELSRYKPEDYVESLAYTVATETKTGKSALAESEAQSTSTPDKGTEPEATPEPPPDVTPPIPEPKEGTPYTD